MRLVAVLLVVLLLPTLVTAQTPALPDSVEVLDLARRKVEEYRHNPVEAYEDINGEQVDREDVRVALGMDFRVLDFDTLGVVFGGGTFQAQARLHGHIEFRVLSVERIAKALKESGIDPCQLGYCANETYITADAFRTTLAGEALAAVAAAEQSRVESLILRTFPNITVISSTFEWSNVNPAVNSQGDPSPTDAAVPSDPFYSRVGTQRLKEPPVILDTVFDLQYVQRVSLLDILRATQAEKAEKKGLLKTGESFLERNAFQQLGIEQELELDVPPGWDIGVALRLPEGYTFEDASPDVLLDPSRQVALTSLSAGSSDIGILNSMAVSLTNRFLVTATLLVVTLLAGVVLRIPASLLATRLRYGRGRR